jgi:hypothetical protein
MSQLKLNITYAMFHNTLEEPIGFVKLMIMAYAMFHDIGMSRGGMNS